MFFVAFDGTSQECSGERINIEYLHDNMPLPNFPMPGTRVIFKQLCTTTIDSIINSGIISFKSALIGEIQHAKVMFDICHDTLETFEISVKKKEYVGLLQDTIVAKYGEPDYIADEGEMIWSKNAGQVLIVLEYTGGWLSRKSKARVTLVFVRPD